MRISFPKDWQDCLTEDAFDRVVNPVDVDPHRHYTEIGIRSHGKGLFKKPPIEGKSLGEKRVFWVEPNCLVLNIIFAWEQAVARTTPNEKGMIASHRFPMFRPKDNVIDLDFALYFFKSKWGKKLLEIGSPGGAGRNKTLSQKEFDELPLCLPPFAEQRRIAAVLGAWDEAIDRTECLIAVHHRRKAALAQKMFGNLSKRPLLEAAEVWFSGVDKKTRAGEAPVLLCNYMDIFHNSRITSQVKFMQATASRRQIISNSLRKHDVVFTKDSETSQEIAEPALIDEQIDNLVCGYHLAIARPRKGIAYGPFIAQAMRHPAIRWQFSRLANGVVRFGLTLDAIEQAEIFLPPIQLQKKIAAVLDAEDVVVENLAKQANLLRTQKRGLMQKLLVGERRLGESFE
jgi:type I restriction enzyme S subunit